MKKREKIPEEEVEVVHHVHVVVLAAAVPLPRVSSVPFEVNATSPATAMSSSASAGAKGGSPIDAKREEFRKYLEKEGILESLTRALVQLYEEPEKPDNGLTYLQNKFTGREALMLEKEALANEVEALKKKVDRQSRRSHCSFIEVILLSLS